MDALEKLGYKKIAFENQYRRRTYAKMREDSTIKIYFVRDKTFAVEIIDNRGNEYPHFINAEELQAILEITKELKW